MNELEKELAALRDSASSGRQGDITLEEAASQTDPPHWTVESGIQVDIMSTSITQSNADTDCVSEDLPFDGDLTVTEQAGLHAPPPPPTTKEALVSVFLFFFFYTLNVTQLALVYAPSICL